MSKPRCTFGDCTGSQVARGWCTKHYGRWKSHGDPGGPPRELDLPGELWLPVVDFEGSYEVSGMARVRSLDRLVRSSRRSAQQIKFGRVLAQTVDTNGYFSVRLSLDGRSTSRQVHALVAEAFIGPRPPGQQVRHGPAGKLDNRPSNLRYGTPAENMRDKRRDGTHCEGTSLPQAKLTEAIVRECRRRYAAGGIAYAALAAEFGVTKQAMMAAVKGRKWKHVDGIPI